MKRIVFLLFFLVVLVVGLGFAVINIDPVKVNYYLGSVEMPLALLIVLSIAVGGVLGVLATMGKIVGAKGEAVRLRRSLNGAQKELEKLRSSPQPDTR